MESEDVGGGGGGTAGPSSSSAGGTQCQKQLEQERNLRREYHQLLQGLAEQEETFETGAGSRLGRDDPLLKSMNQADQLLKSVDTPGTFLLDGRVLRQLSRFCRQNGESLSANLVAFTPAGFADRIKLNMTRRGQAEEERLPTKRHWVTLGLGVRNTFGTSAAFTFMSPAQEKAQPDEGTPKSRKKRATRSIADASQATRVVQQTKDLETEGGKTEALVRSTLVQLRRLYKRNGSEALQYFEFIIDPNSFGVTVENAFHVSFLVKDNQARIFIDDFTKLPLIEPVNGDESVFDENKNINQVVVNLNVYIWKRMKAALKIKSATIKHGKK